MLPTIDNFLNDICIFIVLFLFLFFISLKVKVKKCKFEYPTKYLMPVYVELIRVLYLFGIDIVFL